jgi:Ca2+-transporting ATPase
MINCRSLKDSPFKIGFFSNKTIFAGIASILVLQAILIYVPFMQKVFGTVSLDLRDILMAVVSGFVIFPIIGFEKWLTKKYLK